MSGALTERAFRTFEDRLKDDESCAAVAKHYEDAAYTMETCRIIKQMLEERRSLPIDEDYVRAQLERYWRNGGTDEDIAHGMYHYDAALVVPQSDQCFEGLEKVRDWRRQYPQDLHFEVRNIRGRNDLWVAENSISYDGCSKLTVSILEFRCDKVARESIYETQRSWPRECGAS